jgi:NAD(P)H-dependent FMN reductase
MSASNGALGGLRSLSHLTPLMLNLHCWVCPHQFALGHASDAFAEDGSLISAAHREKVGNVIREALWASERLSA